MNDLQTKQLAVLNDTINHYNTTNRSQANGVCNYYPAHEKSEGCAVGRLIKDKDLCKRLDTEYDKDDGTGIVNASMFNRIPNDIQELGQNFLTDLQGLHDFERHWTEEGLSSEGEFEVNRIKILYDLNFI